VYVTKKTLVAHTCAKELYRRNENKKENRTDSSLFVPMRNRKNKKEKVKKKKKTDNNALPIKKWTIRHYRRARSRYIYIYLYTCRRRMRIE
jgi:hypothetical protein